MTADPAYCPTCGGPLRDRRIEGRTRRYCPDCEQPVYRNPKPCAGVVVVDDRDRVLLVERTEPPATGAWSVPAGYLEADEPPRRAAVRELREETGLSATTSDLRLFDTRFVGHPNDQYVLVVLYVLTRSKTDGTVTPDSDAGDAQFWNLTELQASEERIEPEYDSVFERAVDAVSH